MIELTTPDGVFKSKNICPIDIVNDASIVDNFKKSAFFSFIKLYEYYNDKYPYPEMNLKITQEDYYFEKTEDHE